MRAQHVELPSNMTGTGLAGPAPHGQRDCGGGLQRVRWNRLL